MFVVLVSTVRLRVRRAWREGGSGKRHVRSGVRRPRPQQPGPTGHQGDTRERQQVRRKMVQMCCGYSWSPEDEFNELNDPLIINLTPSTTILVHAGLSQKLMAHSEVFFQANYSCLHPSFSPKNSFSGSLKSRHSGYQLVQIFLQTSGHI